MNALESERLALQARLDDEKTAVARNRMGQFATPPALAHEILAHGVRLLPGNESIRFLDPAVGTGTFYSALRNVVPASRIESATGFEIDPHYEEPAQKLWQDTPLIIRPDDFTQAKPDGNGANLLICNPPYVRHHHIGSAQKAGLQRRAEGACGIRFNGLSGLYCYFMGLAHPFMARGGIAGWLIPGEFMDVNYGRVLKRYLLEKVTLLRIHRYDPHEVQFDDALVSSAVVWVKNTSPAKDHTVTFSCGGTLEQPASSREVAVSACDCRAKWTGYPGVAETSRRPGISLGDLFDIKRGLVTGDNNFFIMNPAQIEQRNLPMECFRPVLPSSRYIAGDEVDADDDGLPLLDKRLFLLDTRLPEDEIRHRYPSLAAYLATGRRGEKPVSERYLCRGRKPWYAQESRPAAPIVCTYMGRSRQGARPFRFLLNHSRATACNTWLMLYPKAFLAQVMEKEPEILRTVWKFLNEFDTEELLGHGRVYGGGLHKLEPKELCGLPIDKMVFRHPEMKPQQGQFSLFESVA